MDGRIDGIFEKLLAVARRAQAWIESNPCEGNAILREQMQHIVKEAEECDEADGPGLEVVYSKPCGCELYRGEVVEIIEGKSVTMSASAACPEHEFVTVLQNKGASAVGGQAK